MQVIALKKLINLALSLFFLLLCLRHGLVDGLHSVSHGELVHDFLSRLLKIYFPRVISFSVRDLYHAAVLFFSGVVE